MKKLAFLFLLTFTTLGFSQKAQTYEYLTMVQIGNREISLSKDNQYEVINISKETQKLEFQNYNPILKRIQEFEEQGWELFSNNLSIGYQTPNQNYVMMRRKK